MEKIIQVQNELNQKFLQELNQNINSILEDEWNRLEKEKEDLKKEREQLKKESEDLKKEKEEWEVLANKLNKAQLRGNKIQLNVGGQIFPTSLSTLTAERGSFFEAMFSGRWEAQPEDDGCYFIDRDPIVFRHVLNYLRGQPPTLNILSPKKLQLLKQDAEFYQLPGLSDYLNSLSTVKYRFVCGPNYGVSSDGLEITKTTTLDQWDVTAITNPIPSSGTHHFKIKIVMCKEGDILIGVCSSSINQSQVHNYKYCGWYFDCSNGKLFSGPPHCAYNRSYYSTAPLLTGREVGVKMDMTNGQISFTVDGEDRGVAYTDIPVNQSLSFCVLLFYPNESVRIVE